MGIIGKTRENDELIALGKRAKATDIEKEAVRKYAPAIQEQTAMDVLAKLGALQQPVTPSYGYGQEPTGLSTLQFI